MPAYFATENVTYNASTGLLIGVGNANDGTYSDTNNEVWTVNEAITESGNTLTFGLPTHYIGYITVNGSDYPVITTPITGISIVLYDNPTDAAATPANLSGLVTSSFTACFLTGTLIDTPLGDVAVETLKIGDSVLTQDGTAVPVKWIGRQSIHTAFNPAERVAPVRFAAGSLGEGLPHTDLTVTADHGMLVNGVICHAGTLVNGSTITKVPLQEIGPRYTVYHIETEEHEIILANGAPAETFIDNVSRRVFNNYAEFETLYGDVPEMEELPYPRAMSARQVPEHIRAKLASKVAA